MKLENEMDPELLSIHALNFSVGNDSSSRSQMFSSHFSQRLVINGSTEKRIQTGVEQDISKYTFSIKMPEDGTIIKVIDRYPKRLDMDAIPESPETLVIYEDIKTKEIGCFSIPKFASFHQYFGFQYVLTPNITKLMPGTFIEKDTIFADSSAVGEHGGYKYGIELNMCFMSHPAVSEDGVLISRDVLDDLKFKVYETRVVEFGSHSFPLNLYGTHDVYKPFPEIGQEIREDGILMMLRKYETDLMPVEMSIYDVMEPDFIFDQAVYVRGPKGIVRDIKIYRDNQEVSSTPFGVMENVEKYSRGLQRFYQELIDTEKQITMDRKKKYGNSNVTLKPELHRLIVEGMAVLSIQTGKSTQKLNKLYRKVPLDDYRAEIVVEYELTPTFGFKLTDVHGGKGVICKIEEPENMPIDCNGVRADIVMDAGSTINRMNLGRLYEQYFGSAAQHLSTNVRKMLDIPQGLSYSETMKRMRKVDTQIQDQVYQHVIEFYALLSEKQYLFFRDGVNFEDRTEHLGDIVRDGIYIFYPIDNNRDIEQAVLDIEASPYKPPYDKVSYVGNSGKRVLTDQPFRIGPLYMMLLEKITDDWSSVSSGKLQHFGILSPTTKSEKYAYPFRNSPVRTIGETEGRIFAGYCGREAIAEMMDRSNNPTTHRHIVWQLLSADQPTNIDKIIDRKAIPLGASKPIQLVRHISMTSGWQPVYAPQEPIKS